MHSILGSANSVGIVQTGAKVYMACRNIEKAEEARSDILKTAIDGQLHILKLDLCSLKSVNACAEEFLKSKYSRHLIG